MRKTAKRMSFAIKIESKIACLSDEKDKDAYDAHNGNFLGLKASKRMTEGCRSMAQYFDGYKPSKKTGQKILPCFYYFPLSEF